MATATAGVTWVWDSFVTTVRRNRVELVGHRVLLTNDGTAVLLGPDMSLAHAVRLTEASVVPVLDDPAGGWTVSGTNAAGEAETWHAAALSPSRQRGCGCGK